MHPLWQENKHLVQIDKALKMRKSKWVKICTDCQCETVITYCQAWNILKGICSSKCFLCNPKKANKGSRKKGDTPWNKGKKWSRSSNPKHKRLFELSWDFDGTFVTDEGREKQRKAKLGKYGEKSNRWQGGKLSERLQAMARDDYKQLRKNAFHRDNFTCQMYLKRGGSLEMHHIKEWCNYPELRYDLSNCLTLCKDCHKKTDNYAYKAKKAAA